MCETEIMLLSVHTKTLFAPFFFRKLMPSSGAVAMISSSELLAGEDEVESCVLKFPELDLKESVPLTSKPRLKVELDASVRKKYAFAKKKVCFLSLYYICSFYVAQNNIPSLV